MFGTVAADGSEPLLRIRGGGTRPSLSAHHRPRTGLLHLPAGTDTDSGWGIAVDGRGKAYVTGFTNSSNYPTTPGAFDRTFNGGNGDACVIKLPTG